ncbi:MAG: hypothetical protein R3C13_01360 [Hyphomonas sp.]|uniref:hypothetical protein n=1 Tax=Hyphomonas sp. TaxID=87 RepID=UPI0035277830
MRSIGLCLVAAFTLVACDDATGIQYTPGTSGPEMMPESGAVPAGGAGTRAVTSRIAYTCDGNVLAKVVLYGAEEMAALTVDGVIDAPVYLECSPTRAGPECREDTLHILINTVSGGAEISDSATDFALSCTEAEPG